MSAWGTQFDTKGKIRMLADPNAAFTKAVDLSLELAPLGKTACLDQHVVFAIE